MTFVTRAATIVAGALMITAAGAAAQSPQRLSDNDIKRLVADVDQARDRFEDQLDGKVKNGIVRGPAGEIRVKSALEDFERDMENLKSRFAADYAASAEVQAVLRRANLLHDIMQAQPAGLKGTSEWEKLATQLRGLAGAYAAEFPLAEGGAARRTNDAEAAASAGLLVEQADALKDTINADRTLAKPDKTALKNRVAEFAKQAKVVESRLKEHEPATSEMRALHAAFAALAPEGSQLPPAVLKVIGAMRAPFDKLDRAFGVVPRPATF
jgi:hypothetical protein